VFWTTRYIILRLSSMRTEYCYTVAAWPEGQRGSCTPS